MSFDTHRARTLRAVISGLLGTAAFAASVPQSYAQTTPTLETVTVTAQRRETDLQTTPVAISAYGGEALAENKIFTVNDLAASVPAFSLTALTPLDAELNIRGITNTRLDSPTADPSVGTFVDGVYMGRTGDLNYDFYDLERIEVIRGPQGVLLGKNVVGGALSVITAKPTFEPSGNVLVSYGNYNSIARVRPRERRAQRLVGGARSRSRAASTTAMPKTFCINRDVDDLESYQARVQFLYGPDGSKFRGRLALDYNHDETNGLNTVAVAGGTTSCETIVPAHQLHASVEQPARVSRSHRSAQERRAEHPVRGPAAHPAVHGARRLRRHARPGVRGDGLHLQLADCVSRTARVSRCTTRPARVPKRSAGTRRSGRTTSPSSIHTFGTRPATSNNGQFLFAQPVGEDADVQQFSQEFRLTSNNPDSRLDWIAGVYLKSDDIDKVDRFIGENFLGTRDPGRQQSAVDAVGREPLGQRRQDRELRGLRADRLQVHRHPEAQRRRALHARQEGRQRQRPRGRDRRSLQPERSAAERDDRRPVPHADRRRRRTATDSPRRASRRTSGSSPPAPASRRTTRRAGARSRRRRPSSGRRAIPVPVRDGRRRLQGRRLRRHAGERRAGGHAVRSGKGDATTRSASRRTCSTAACG